MPKNPQPRAVNISRTAAARLAQHKNKSAVIRDAIHRELVSYPGLPPRRAQQRKEDSVRLTVRVDAATAQALERYTKYGLCRAFIARAIERACE